MSSVDYKETEAFALNGYELNFLITKNTKSYFEMHHKEVDDGKWQKWQKVRALCVVNKWQKNKLLWHDVVSSSLHLKYTKVTSPQELKDIAFGSFLQQFSTWNPQNAGKILITLKKKKRIKGESFKPNLDIVFLKDGTKKVGLIKTERDTFIQMITFGSEVRKNNESSLIMKKISKKYTKYQRLFATKKCPS
ncbi:hypothetical protein [Candidatus Uabimicrobium sp. HlEnr_7]|uniref:hypothetical protein n=1 Tax=Candidatus Uabimicrobium helgolandensis TaxID=3095367 RepID=UPI003555FCF2